MKNNRLVDPHFVPLSLCCALLLCLCGCQLAQPDAGGSTAADTLVGVYVTPEYIDLFDAEAWLSDTLRGSGSKGGDFIVSEAAAAEHTGRMPAVFDEHAPGKFSFPEAEGWLMTLNCTTVADEPCWGVDADPAFADVHIALNSTDAGDENTLSGTLYCDIAAESTDGKVFYINSVYRTADGDVYLVPGSGVSMGGMQAEGSMCSTTISAKISTAVNGEAVTSIENSFTVGLSAAYGGEAFTFVQFSDAHEVLASDEYTAGTLPEEIEWLSETDYILIEQRYTTLEGEPHTKYTLCDRSAFTPYDGEDPATGSIQYAAVYCRRAGSALLLPTEIALRLDK